MPTVSHNGVSSSGQKTPTIPAPPSLNQSTLIDKVLIMVNNVSAAGNTYAQLTVPTQVSDVGANMFFVTPFASGASASTILNLDFPGGLQVRNTNGTVAALLDCIPNGNAASMSVMISYHYA